jgi:hypothetical protein
VVEPPGGGAAFVERSRSLPSAGHRHGQIERWHRFVAKLFAALDRDTVGRPSRGDRR